MTNIARLRAETDIRQAASPGSAAIERFPSNALVEITEDAGDWLKIKPLRLSKTVNGYVPRLALVCPDPPPAPVFPLISLDGGTRVIPSVPPKLALGEFLAWFNAPVPVDPPWIPAADLAQLDQQTHDDTLAAIIASMQNNHPAWQDWLASVNAEGRQAVAVMDEWIVQMGDGREMFAIRDHVVYQTPRLGGPSWGTALKGQILRWTGRIQKDTSGEGYTFYDVEFYRMSRAMRGWFRGDLLAAYTFPTELNDPEIEANKAYVFDLTQPILRHPQDPEFAEAKAEGYSGAQYLNLRQVLGHSLVHFMLCGEICCSALTGSDVIPLLNQWRASGYFRAETVVTHPKEGTGTGDLQSILRMFSFANELYNSVSVSAQFVKDRLLKGDFAISGCGITASGKVTATGTIRHWVIVEDVLPVGNSGWVRIYNPFNNREEVYEFNLFLLSAGTGSGLWVTPQVQGTM